MDVYRHVTQEHNRTFVETPLYSLICQVCNDSLVYVYSHELHLTNWLLIHFYPPQNTSWRRLVNEEAIVRDWNAAHVYIHIDIYIYRYICMYI